MYHIYLNIYANEKFDVCPDMRRMIKGNQRNNKRSNKTTRNQKGNRRKPKQQRKAMETQGKQRKSWKRAEIKRKVKGKRNKSKEIEQHHGE